MIGNEVCFRKFPSGPSRGVSFMYIHPINESRDTLLSGFCLICHVNRPQWGGVATLTDIGPVFLKFMARTLYFLFLFAHQHFCFIKPTFTKHHQGN